MSNPDALVFGCDARFATAAVRRRRGGCLDIGRLPEGACAAEKYSPRCSEEEMNVCLAAGRTFAVVVLTCALGCEHAVGDPSPAAVADPLDAQGVQGDCGASRCPQAIAECVDLAESDSDLWSARADDGARSDRVEVTQPLQVVRGARSLRMTTSSGALAFLRYAAPSGQSLDARGAVALELVLRGRNSNAPTWQGNAPVVALIDTAERRRVLVPDRMLLSDDGHSWARVSVPLAGGPSARGGVSFT